MLLLSCGDKKSKAVASARWRLCFRLSSRLSRPQIPIPSIDVRILFLMVWMLYWRKGLKARPITGVLNTGGWPRELFKFVKSMRHFLIRLISALLSTLSCRLGQFLNGFHESRLMLVERWRCDNWLQPWKQTSMSVTVMGVLTRDDRVHPLKSKLSLLCPLSKMT